MLIKCKFLKGNVPAGREYTYSTPDVVKVGDTVQINEKVKGVVTTVNVPEAEVEAFAGKIKSIIGKVEE